MNLLLALLVAGSAVLGVIVGGRSALAKQWRASLVAYRLHLPAALTPEDTARWLGMLAACTHGPKWSLVPESPLVLEIEADHRGIRHYLLFSERRTGQVLSSIRAGLPGARLEAAPNYLRRPFNATVGAEATATSRSRPLATERTDALSSALLASLQPLSKGEVIRWQVTFTSAGTPAPIHAAAPRPQDQWWSSYLLEGEAPPDAEAVRAARIKQKDQLMQVTIRLGVQTSSRPRALSLLNRTWSTLHNTNAAGVRIVRRFLASQDVAGRLKHRSLPLTAWPLLLSTAELSGFVGFVGAEHLPGIATGAARQLPPPMRMHRRSVTLGLSNYPGMTDRPITLGAEDRLRHLAIVAPTGAGKSWLLARMILSDIDAGHGVFVIDPKGDLISDVLARVGDKDADRLVVVDAARREQPMGLNVLGHARDEAGRELLVDNVLSVFTSIWSGFWGPRSDAVMRSGLNLLVNARGMDDSRLTLVDFVPMLTQPGFRQRLTKQPTVPPTVRDYWQRHDQLSDGDQMATIRPVLQKVEAFTSRSAIRLMLGQSKGIDLSAVFRERKVVLISLSEGTLGRETASLLGSLLVSLLWQTTLARVTVSAEKRAPFFAFIDEAPNLMRLPLPLSEIFSQARGLGLGITTALQFLTQAPDTIRAALLGTVRSQLTMAVEHEDAVILAKRFSPLTVDDLKGLARFEAAARLCVDGVTQTPATLTTLPLDEPTRDPDELATASRERYGVPRADVEGAIAARSTPPTASFGRYTAGATT
ncbi:DUF87 domain-containing protein [Amycolatopsis sp., V23-08]|uniref:DUF87 domain-containing protein n=1 Tax=Amycolatopsis heterodermiae TaxID=3110235 RepID=A0ABU5QXV5_9PSEU|nr:DUF87 domain-containing protein [Amycolatopsis sp., V23-08]MEA5358763.1 DUF87 domain-containing protein [Amycolatopsis sp., V23-08]